MVVMGMKDNLDRYRKIGEENRMDLTDFIKHGDLGAGRPNTPKIPIKIISLPEYTYDQFDSGGVGQAGPGQGEPDVGQPLPNPGEGQGDGEGEDGEPGEDDGEHGYYEMDPEEFAQELDDILGLDLEPKGKDVINEHLGEFKEMERRGTRSTMDFDYFFKKALQREAGMYFDDEYVKEALQVDGWDDETVFSWLRGGFDEQYVREALQTKGMGVETVKDWADSLSPPMHVPDNWLEKTYQQMKNDPDTDFGKWSSIEEMQEHVEREGVGLQIRVGREWIQTAYDQLQKDSEADLEKWSSIEEMQEHVEPQSYGQSVRRNGVKDLRFRQDDERFKHQEIEEEYEHSVVMAYIRDVSGSMGDEKKDLVERTFTPLDWYLRGKYDNAVSIYIVHDNSAWEVERVEFFGKDSGGGTTISTAYEIVDAIFDGDPDRITDTQGGYRSVNNHYTGQQERRHRILQDKHPSEGYPWENWNRYVFAAGDGENSTKDTEKSVIPFMENIDANLHAYIQTQPGGGSSYANHLETLDEHDWPDDTDYVGVEVNDEDDILDALYEILSVEGESEY